MWTVLRQVCFQEKQRRHCLGRFSKKKFFEPIHLGEATLAWYALHLQEARQVRERAPHTHWLFIKLLWLMDKHAASADRVVNIDETSCRLLPVHETAT